MKPTPITFIPSETYKAVVKEASNRCIRVGCSVDDAVDYIQIIDRELAKKNIKTRKRIRIS